MAGRRVKRGLSTRVRRTSTSRFAGSRGRGKKILIVVITGVILSTGAAGLAALTRTAPMFRLSSIDVGGNHLVSSRRALQMVPVEEGTNIFAIDLEAMERTLEQDPRIRDVIIRRQLPSRIVITIEEREPVMLLIADQIYGIDEEGAVIPMGADGYLRDLPVLTGVFPEIQPGSGAKHLGIHRGLQIRSAIIEAAPSLIDKISEINVDHPETALLYLVQSGMQVRLGSGDLNTQLQRLWLVLSDLAARGITAEFLDLRFKDQVVCQTIS